MVRIVHASHLPCVRGHTAVSDSLGEERAKITRASKENPRRRLNAADLIDRTKDFTRTSGLAAFEREPGNTGGEVDARLPFDADGLQHD
jgi:hypothetical protein